VAAERQVLPLALESDVPRAARFKTHVPVFDLTAAAGGWGPDGTPTEIGWASVSDRKLDAGMFVAQVIGQSMLPQIPSGAWCLFRACPAGSKNGRLLLIQCQTQGDPHDGGRYTVKRYKSVKVATADGLVNALVQLEPLNPEFTRIELTPDDAVDLRVIGEFVCVVADRQVGNGAAQGSSERR
jgi:SOS-response transcriptional repressor LexA